MSLCCARSTCGLKYLLVEKGSGQVLIDVLHLQRDSTASRPNLKKKKKKKKKGFISGKDVLEENEL